MKAGIHPEYKLTTIACACGEVIHIRSTRENIKIGICSKCHPYYTGRSKFVDTAGRVERFKKKYGEEVKIAKPPKPVKPKPVASVPKAEKPKKAKEVKAETKPEPKVETPAQGN